MSASNSIAFDIVLPTRNRCPYALDSKEAIRNPLIWTLETIAANAGAALRRVIVVDDSSTDHTAAALEAMAALRPQLRLSHIRLARRCGSAAARNRGAQLATADWLLFTDDDCLFGRHSIDRAAELIVHLLRRDAQTAALNFPYYLRQAAPARRVPASEIGAFDPGRGRVSGNFDAVPENAHADRTPVGEEQLAHPIPIRNLGCTFAVDKHVFAEAGGFPEEFYWENSYGEETELAARITEVGGNLYYAPDPRCSVIHMKYGAMIPLAADGHVSAAQYDILQTSCCLQEFSAWSNQPQADSGNRVDPSHLIYSRVLSYFHIIYRRSVWGSFLWLLRSYQEVVRTPSGAAAAGLSRRERLAIWRSAAWHGIRRCLRPCKSTRSVVCHGQLT
jgi:glycosyltransferase involved in cell wall biosynthesis